MKLQKYCFRFIKITLATLVSGNVIANDLPSSVNDSYISLGIEHSQSDNINKVSTDPSSGYEQSIDFGVGYFNQTATNFTALDYSISYDRYSEDELGDDVELAGSLNMTQEIFSKNLLLNLGHFRRSYLLDQTQVDIPDNNGNRDVFTVNPVWIIPYSRRAGFQLSYNYIATRFSDDSDQNTERNGLGVTWYHNLNAKTRFDFTTEFSKVELDTYDYTQLTADASLTGKLYAGSYLIQLGYSRLMVDQGFEAGGIFKLAYDYQLQKHNIAISAERELSDSSFGSGNDFPDNSLEDFDGSKVIWIDRFQLQHQFAISSRFNNQNSIYYQQETEVVTNDVDPRWGLASALNFQHTKRISSYLAVDYSESTNSSDFDKQVLNTTIGARYLFRPELTFSLQANYEDQSTDDDISAYDEIRYTARIEFKH